MGKHTRIRISLFPVLNGAFLVLVSLFCLMPIVNMLAVSVSAGTEVASGHVGLWPVGFNLKSYEYVLKSGAFLRALWNSVLRVAVGVTVNMFLTVITAYPLSREKRDLRARTAYAWFFVLTTLLSAGLIPWYMTIKFTGILNTFWALILPGAVPVFNVVVLLNFFRGLPKELEESAFLDGANQWTTLWKIFVPLSTPSLATLTLFCIITHWNSWFDGLILMSNPSQFPLQSYLQTVVISPEQFFNTNASRGNYKNILAFVNARTAKAAQIFIAALPVLAVYPFLQKFFTKGLVLGSIKG